MGATEKLLEHAQGEAIHVVKSVCRSCITYCPIDVTVQGNKVLDIEPNYEAPLYEGFICPKGRALKAAHHDPNRLLHHLKRMPDGSHVPISSEQLVEEIAVKMKDILDQHGPRAISTFLGGPSTEQPACTQPGCGIGLQPAGDGSSFSPEAMAGEGVR